MDMTMARYRAYPDRVWLLMQDLVAQGLPPHPQVPHGDRIRRYALSGDGAAGDPELQRAHQIYQSGNEKPELEARLMTDMTLDDIAGRMQLPPAVVRLYRDIFFDPRPQFHHPSEGPRFIGFLRSSHPQTGEALLLRQVAAACPDALELLIAGRGGTACIAQRGMAERVRRMMQLSSMPLNDPGFLKLLGQLRKDVRALNLSQEQLLQANAYLEILRLAAKGAKGGLRPTALSRARNPRKPAIQRKRLGQKAVMVRLERFLGPLPGTAGHLAGGPVGP